MTTYILTVKCPDQKGIIAHIAPFLAERGGDIRASSDYGDPETKSFFVRMVVAATAENAKTIQSDFSTVAKKFDMEWAFYNQDDRLKVLIAVSKFDHCLLDMLHKWKVGSLPIDIVGIVSNHQKCAEYADWYNLPFHHLPITKETKPQQEAAFKNIIEKSGAELTVLARYMQILSDDFSQFLSGRCINIHHSFLPSFKGARPYHQAHARGVKLIGATAHFVTADLDEGPIIEQEVRRVDHAVTPEEMTQLGHETEARVLSRAVRWYAEHRIALNGSKTVVL